MTCNHEFRTLPDQEVYQWCHQCGAICRLSDLKVQVPRLLDVVEIRHIELTEQEKAYCLLDQKIYAIRDMKRRTGLGLSEVKRMVDEFMRSVW